jgi:hypothetical protein
MRVNSTSIVTSLQPADGSPITVRRCGTTTDANTGDLVLDVELQLSSENAGLDDYIVPKRVQGTKLLTGPVVSKIRAGTGISISSPSGVPEGCGEVTVALTSGEGYAGDFGKIAYRNAKQELIGMFPYTRLLGWTTAHSDPASGFVAQFQVPYTVVGEYQVYVYMTVFGEEDIAYSASGANVVKYAGLTFDYSVLRDYNPSDDTYGTLPDNVITPANGPARVEIPFGVAGGVTYKDADDNETTKVYGAYDPMVVHNNATEADVAGRIVRVIDTPFPAIGDKKGNVTTVAPITNVTVRAGSMVGIELQRGDVTDRNNEYTAAIGITQLRWRLTRVD